MPSKGQYSYKAKREIHVFEILFGLFSLLLFYLLNTIMSVLFVVSDGDRVHVQS